MRHSGEASRRCTSATVTLYLDVELSRLSRPGTELKMSVGANSRDKSARAGRTCVPQGHRDAERLRQAHRWMTGRPEAVEWMR